MSVLEQVLRDAVILLLLGWPLVRFLGPRWLDHKLSQRLQSHQATLDRQLEEFRLTTQAKADAQLEVARAEIARGALEHQVRFTRLHEQRARVISGTFARLDRLHRAIRGLTQMIDTQQYQPMTWNEAIESFKDFQRYYYERSIWLDPETIALINPIVDLLSQPFSMLALALSKGRNSDDLRQAIQQTISIVDERVPAARRALEARFRSLLEGATLSPSKV
jgi:hypothetical protein